MCSESVAYNELQQLLSVTTRIKPFCGESEKEMRPNSGCGEDKIC